MLKVTFKVRIDNYRYFSKINLDVFPIPVRRRVRHKKIIDPENVNFLVSLLGIEQSNAVKIIEKYKGRKKFSYGEIARTHAVCLRYGIDNNEILSTSTVLFLRPNTLEQRINFFKDIGCPKITLSMLSPFYNQMNLSVTELKAKQFLPADADVTKNLLSCLHEPPPNVPRLNSLPDEHTLENIHLNVLRHYLQWKFEYTEEQIERIIASKSRMKHQSFTLLKQMVDVLLNEFQFSKERIRRNSFLLSKSPYNTRQIIDEISHIGCTPTRELIPRYPRLLNVQVDMLHEKLKLLKEFNVSDETTSNCPDIFTLAFNTIRDRLIEFKTIKELQGHWSHPRVLMLVFYLRGVRRRIQILNQLNVRCSSLHILCTSEKAFQRYIMMGSDRTKGRDITRFLSCELNVELNDPLLLLLKRHSLWCQIPFLHVQECYGFLKEQNYSNEDILKNIQIVLYRSSQISRELVNINSTTMDSSWTPSRKLALCLYNIEKKYHFNGNGVWNCQQNESVQHRYEEIRALRPLAYN